MNNISNKKAEIPWYILSIILVVITLAVLVFGLWQAIANSGGKFIGDKDNTGLIIKECEVACLSGISDEYCARLREVYSPDKSIAGKRTCKFLESKLDDIGCNQEYLNC